jgi:hypothetical protein
MDTNQNPEALHDVAQDKAIKVGAGFVNPGTPDKALVSREQMTQATIKGADNATIVGNLIK